MNIRKPVDYSAMYVGLDHLMAAGLPQMELYCGIGKVISERPEKGAAVIAAEYLQAKHPDISGFSPRNTRRMREFYRTYENSPALLDEAMKIGWTQNVVILEAELSPEEKEWYIRVSYRFGWSKLELTAQISDRAHESVLLDTPEESCYTESEATPLEERDDEDIICVSWEYLPQPHGGICDEGHGSESRIGGRDPDILRRH